VDNKTVDVVFVALSTSSGVEHPEAKDRNEIVSDKSFAWISRS